MNEFIRKLDGLGRIVIPKEYRRKLKISNDSKLKISVENDFIKIEKYSEIDNNINELDKYRKILNKYLDINIMITDLEVDINSGSELPELIKNKIRYGKIDVLNDEKDILFKSDKKINLIIIPIILYGEVIGSIIGYNYDKKFDNNDIKTMELIQIILIKNIEE